MARNGVTNTNVEKGSGKNLWSQFLNEVRDKSCNQVAQRRFLLFLGNNNAGKSSLIAQLQNVSEVKRGNGLEYHYLDVKEEGRNEHMKLSVWVSDGDPALSYLLNNALNEKTFPDCLAVIVASMDEPWNILDSLQRWADLLENQVQRLRLSKEELQEYKESLVRHFRSYIDPDIFTGASENTGTITGLPASMTMSISAHIGLSSLATGNDGGSVALRRVIENPLHPSAMSCGNVAHLAASFRYHHGSESHTNGRRDSEGSDYGDDEDAENNAHSTLSADGLLPLPSGVFERNIGIPIVVVISKLDCMPVLRKEHNFSDEYFDFMQMHIRQFCLKYGAALVYTSVREDKNCDLLNRYLRHRVFGFPFQHSAYVVEADSVFVPCGWDDPRKINVLNRSLINVKPNQPFSEVFPRPNINRMRGSAQREQEIVAEDEQILLNRLAVMLSKQQAQQQAPNTNNPPTTTSNVELTTPSGRANSSADSSQYSTPVTPRGMAIRKTPAMSAMSAANLPVGVAGSVGGGSNERVLTSFFNSLLTKQRASNPNQLQSSPSTTSNKDTKEESETDDCQ